MSLHLSNIERVLAASFGHNQGWHDSQLKFHKPSLSVCEIPFFLMLISANQFLAKFCQQMACRNDFLTEQLPGVMIPLDL